MLDAGDDVLKDLGFKGFTMRECARRAGVSHAAPKHHFTDVTGLLTAIAARGFTRMRETLVAELEAAMGDLHEEFAATTRGYLKFAMQYPEHFRLMFRNDLLNAEDDELWHAASETFAVLTNVILRQRGEPEITGETLRAGNSPREIAGDIVIGWSHIHGYAHLVLEQQLRMVDPEDRRKLVDGVAARLSDLIQDVVPRNHP